MPQDSSSSPSRRAYARIAASAASRCLRRLGLWIHSHTRAQASSRVMLDGVPLHEMVPWCMTAWRLLLVGSTNAGQSLVVQAEQGDDLAYVFRTTDPAAHPARLRQYMMRARPAARNQFVADPRRKRQVGQPVAVEMSNLAVVDSELDSAEAVGLRDDARPAQYLLRDRVGGLPHGASSGVAGLRRGGPVAGPQRDLRQRHHHQQRRQQQDGGVRINPRDAGAERRPEYLMQLRHRGPRY